METTTAEAPMQLGLFDHYPCRDFQPPAASHRRKLSGPARAVEGPGRRAESLLRTPAGRRTIADTADTSRGAYLSAREKLPERAEKLLDWIIARGRRGATLWEASCELGILYASIPSIFGRLRRAGLIAARGDTRRTASGSAAQVWTAALEDLPDAS